MSETFRSWGYSPSPRQRSYMPSWSSEFRALIRADPDLTSIEPVLEGESTWLPVGNGRSYGDSCLNKSGLVVGMTGLDRFIKFDANTGTLIAEAGLRLCDVLRVIVSYGWFLPVSPGTAFVTLGGAVANDVHGKNHHSDGTFGCHVQGFTLLTSDGELHWCSPEEEPGLYNATIGGLGLTGVLITVQLKLLPIRSTHLSVRYNTFSSLREFAELSAYHREGNRYTVAWMDCAGANTAGRGVFISANHDTDDELTIRALKPKFSVPFSGPKYLLNKHSIRAFNSLYYAMQVRKTKAVQKEYFQGFFYPLDSIQNWNRIYGSKGFHQYQFVVPLDALEVLQQILDRIVASGMGSFLAVLKEFGHLSSPGLLSFPRPGYCLALDFSNRGQKTEQLIKSLDYLVREAGGAAYPAKDRLMSAESFQAYFPGLDEFRRYVDPKISSDFWQRVSA